MAHNQSLSRRRHLLAALNLHLYVSLLTLTLQLPSTAAISLSQYTSQQKPSNNSGAMTFDYVIIGSGPGGSVMARRLTEDPDITVAVIEAGTWVEDVVGNMSTVPGYDGPYNLVDPASSTYPDDWGFITTPQAGMNGLQSRYMRGKGLGGSSNLNAMAWSDNPVGVFHRWAKVVGDKSWEFDTVTKYYAKAMNFTGPGNTRWTNTTPKYDPTDVSQGGPLSVTYPAYAHSWSTWMATALDAIGLPRVNSFINGGAPLIGSAWLVNTIDHTNGHRASADQAYLRPVMHQRSNLYIFRETLAERILFDNNTDHCKDSHGTNADATTAIGVTVSQNNGSTQFSLQAKREVILSAGAFQSPQLLQVSGVGPRAMLRAHGIPVVADRPGVGQNLQDQFFFGLSYRLDLPTVSNFGSSPSALEAVKLYTSNATGPLSTPGGEYAGFEKLPTHVRSGFSRKTESLLATYPADWPEAGYLQVPAVAGNGRANGGPSPPPSADLSYGTILGLIQTPTSRGNVSIKSSFMRDHPNINPNWLGTQTDLEIGIAIFKRVREAWTALQQPQPANGTNNRNASIVIGDRVFPDSSAGLLDTDAKIGAWLRGNILPIYHAAATNKMGKRSDPMAVVDSEGRVYGTSNLRVADISAFPFLHPGTAPQATVYMLSEKIADDVKASRRAGRFW